MSSIKHFYDAFFVIFELKMFIPQFNVIAWKRVNSRVFKIFSLCYTEERKSVRFRKTWEMSKWWQNCNFGKNYPLKWMCNNYFFFFLLLYRSHSVSINSEVFLGYIWLALLLKTLNEVTPEVCWTWEFADDLSHIYALTPPDFARDPHVLIQEHN